MVLMFRSLKPTRNGSQIDLFLLEFQQISTLTKFDSKIPQKFPLNQNDNARNQQKVL